MTTHDAEWTPDDRAMALAWQTERDAMCGGCGLPRDETMSHERDGPEFDAEAVRCRACLAREISAAQFAGRDKPEPSAGLFWAVHKHDQNGGG